MHTAGAAACAAAAGGLRARAQQAALPEARFLRIGAGSLGGVNYPIARTLALALSNPPGSPPCDKPGGCGVPGLVVVAQSTPGSVANLQAIAAGTLDSAFVQADIAYWAYTGTRGFADKAPLESLRSIANLYPEDVQIVVRKGAAVDTVRDLKGKRVSLDEQGSGTLATARLILQAFGLTENDLQVSYLPADQAAKGLQDGSLDALFLFAGYPAPAISELAGGVAIDLLPIIGAPAADLRSRYGFFATDIVPVGVYKGVVRTETLSVGAQWVASASLPEPVVHDVTAALWNDSTRQALERSNPRAKLIRLETALNGLGVPLHPGAERFYREAGLIKTN